jgi:uncharacterized FlaG/YvyC family protein
MQMKSSTIAFTVANCIGKAVVRMIDKSMNEVIRRSRPKK